MKKLWLFVTLCFYTALAVSQSQSFPVQVIPQAIPPAPILFSDYADNTTINSPLRVQIILNDFTISNREIRLKTYFEGNGITFQSNDNVSGAPSLFLEGGIPTILTNVELAPYFRFENITGISPNVYGQTIPEGVYQFCFEVYDVLTGRRLSNRSCVTTVIFKNDPPFLVSPLDKTNIQEQNPQNIVFQWTPRHINVTNVEYELSIVEIWDNYVDPQTAFLSSPPVFQTTTTATTYVYGPADPLFLPNKKYAWRVQAKAKRGTEEIGLFKNQGYSEIFSFSYATPCDKPVSVTHESKGAHQVNIAWEDFTTEIPKFKVRYRKQGDNGEWFYSQTSANWITLWDLRSETTYEFQIRKLCSVSESDWTIIDTFTTGNEQDETALYNCGIPPDINLENQNPLPSIEKGESFKAGDFDIKILEVSGAEGRFTGEGYVTIPYLRSIKVGVKFTNILINTDKQLAEGMVVTSYNIDAGNIIDVDDAIDTVSDVVEGVGELFEDDNDLDEININFDIEKEDIKIVDNRIVITNPETGDQFDYAMGDDTVITDASGDVYHVDEQGKITKGGQKDPGGIVNSNNVNGVSNNGEIESLTARGLVVYFKDTGKFGFDQVPDSQKAKLTDHYLTIKDEAGKDYTLIHQAVQKGDSTIVIAEVKQQGNAYELNDIIFKTKQGEKLNSKVVGDKIEVTVQGHYSFENETIYVVVPSKTEENKQLTAGAFTLWHLTERTVDVVLVPVNGASLRANEVKQVADIFKKGAAKLNIKVGEAFTFDKNSLGANGLDVGDSPWLTAYNEEQKSVMAAFKQDPKSNYNKNTYYVFVFSDITPSRNIAGFMPLQRQYGFVFDNTITAPEEGKGDLTKTIAHEIGHGVFALQHPFTKLKTDEGQTSWLMDYSAGKDDNLLSHMDWAQIHNPDLKFYIFQDEEEGQSSVASRSYDFEIPKSIDVLYTEEKLPLSIKPSDISIQVFDYEGLLSSEFESFFEKLRIGDKYKVRVFTYNSQTELLNDIESIVPKEDEIILFIQKKGDKSLIKISLGIKVNADLLKNGVTKEELFEIIKDSTSTELKQSIVFNEIKANVLSYTLVKEAEAYDGNIMALIAIKLLDWGVGGIENFKIPEKHYNSDILDYSPLFGPDPIENAFMCGIFNGLIREAKAIPELASMLIKISNSEENRKKLKEDIDKLIEAGVLNTILQGLAQRYMGQSTAMVGYKAGEDVVAVATIFVSFTSVTKAGKVTSIIKLVNPLQGALDLFKLASRTGLSIKKSAGTIILYAGLNINKIVAKIDAKSIYRQIKWIDKGNTLEVIENVRYIDNAGEETIGSLAILKNGDEVGFKVNNLGGLIDELFPTIKNHPDFQAFKKLCINNPKVSVKIASNEWVEFVARTKNSFGIGRKRNIVKMEFDGKEYLIASGKGYNGQMIESGKFIPEDFVLELEKGQRVFTPSISTRHLDTELIGLEYFAKLKNAVKGVKYPKINGTVRLTSDLCPCPSCSSIFQQFSDMFPNVTVDITTTSKLHY
ncbi:deaminase domain-containing protein [Aquimarina mytili]|uniref:Fibronectin type III domain-containing protein n=1 Tax=Aquimarina mytili TaxID=874423 RepID=A0A937DB07_9FLAO|nr:deaminase domain-containing protein [Aquimarina mytili]MBL0685272.1 fibronectin type III domain-containing protein [Aquimarina mytili]